MDFTLTGADGAEHSYTVVLHPAREGQRITFRLVGAAADPLGRLVAAWAKMDDAQVALAQGVAGLVKAEIDINKVVESVDWSQVGADVRALLWHESMTDIVCDIFAHTIRDGAPMSNGTAYDKAYRGNYWELMQAAWRIVQANGFFPLSSIFEAGPISPS